MYISNDKVAGAMNKFGLYLILPNIDNKMHSTIEVYWKVSPTHISYIPFVYFEQKVKSM